MKVTVGPEITNINKSLLHRHEFFYLHEVTEAFLTEDIFEEDQVLFMVGIRVELRGEQGQSLMQPYGYKKTTQFVS